MVCLENASFITNMIAQRRGDLWVALTHFQPRRLLYTFVALIISILSLRTQAQDMPPTLDDWWDGRAEWVIEHYDVGLPMGESDTLRLPDGSFVSYAHASARSAGVIDQCGDPAPFPGCLTRWTSPDGVNFSLPLAMCTIPCRTCPCTDERDHIQAQQYPRVVRADDGIFYMAYEWHAQTMLRSSPDGIVWSDPIRLTQPSGTWPPSFAPCSPTERIGEHPFIRGQADGCLVGAPPSLYMEGDELFVFVTAGSAPSHLRCYRGSRQHLDALQVCQTDPLFGGAREYGDLDAYGADANAHFDFRYVSSADLLKVGERYYMTYEGIRGPDQLERGLDTQFALGFARSLGNRIDGAWEVYTGNPVLMDSGFNWGVGHADLLVLEGVTYLYSATSQHTRGRYKLVWKPND